MRRVQHPHCLIVTSSRACYLAPVNATVANHPAAPPGQEEWWSEFAAAARRPLATRWRYAFIRTHKPVLDDARYRSFGSMAEYRAWCEANLPDWLGYHRPPAGH